MKLLILALFVVCLTACNEQTLQSPPSTAPQGKGDVPPTPPVDKGTDVGNGGDHVRSMFLNVGEAVIKYLETHENGKKLTQSANLSLENLKATLSIQKITTIDGVLKDNGGSDVDAVGIPGSITLKRSSWLEHFEKDRDIYYLVLHEMLRSAAVKDDGYVISKAAFPFPNDFKIATRLVALIPLVPSDLLTPYVSKDTIQFGGTGCPSSNAATYADFNAETNVLDLTFKAYGAKIGEQSTSNFARLNCSSTIPLQAPEGMKLVISQVDLNGTVKLPTATKATVQMEAFTAGGIGENHSKVYGWSEVETNGRVLIRINDTVETECGKAANLRVATSVRLEGKPGAETAINMDRLLIYLKLEKCN